MADTLEGFPFWILNFDEHAKLRDPAAEEALADGIGSGNLTDLFVFSHGWNNEPSYALSLHNAFFAHVRQVLDDSSHPRRREARIGICGIIWPSVMWPDESPAKVTGGAVSLDAPDSDPFTEMRKVLTDPQQQALLNELEQMLREKKRNDTALNAFLDKLAELAAPPNAGAAADITDSVELRGIHDTRGDWREVLQVLAEGEDVEGQGGAAGLGDAFGKLWAGAKGALRVTSYWMMKDRAGKVGRNGLGPLIGRLHSQFGVVRFHLIGHSFGARVVSFALAGLPVGFEKENSPVKSVLLLQGAFSHFTFANTLPFDSRRSGELKGMAARVDGPLLATHSLKDLAVGRAYPLASFVARQDAAASEPDRWAAIGNDGVQAVDAGSAPLGRPGTIYYLKPGHWLNLDGNRVIVNGGLPSRAHSDIFHPHTAWAAVTAAGLR